MSPLPHLNGSPVDECGDRQDRDMGLVAGKLFSRKPASACGRGESTAGACSTRCSRLNWPGLHD
jgi:hypothetical protein